MRYGIDPIDLVDLLEYNSLTGDLTWKTNSLVHNKVRGLPAGCLKQHSEDPQRYDLVVQIRGFKIPAQNVIWAMEYGEWPDTILDHIDGNPLNYRINNLRKSDSTLNSHNRKTYANNELGMKNIRFKNGKYQVRKSFKGKNYCKSWDSLEEAIADRNRVVLELLKDTTYLRNTDKGDTNVNNY